MGLEITRCKHGKDLTQAPCYMCKSLWKSEQSEDEMFELEQFFQKGIMTINGCRARIKELEKALEHAKDCSPRVTCARCDMIMNTFKVRDVADAFSQRVHREVAYQCERCHEVVWVRKLRHPLEDMMK